MFGKFLEKLGLGLALSLCAGCVSVSFDSEGGKNLPIPPPKLVANGFILNRVGTTEWPPPPRWQSQRQFGFTFGNDVDSKNFFERMDSGSPKWYDSFERDHTVPWPSSGRRLWVYVCTDYEEDEDGYGEQNEEDFF
ncbi:MAG: hypothetical protein LBI77_01835 [Puniceicoccales bacterium]|jgi:hypothetical protein|nr:hypothetical protein [Puniceicoccales bacterium]